MTTVTTLVVETVHLDQDLSEAIDLFSVAYYIPRDKLIRRILREHMEALGAIEWPSELAEDTPVSGEA